MPAERGKALDCSKAISPAPLVRGRLHRRHRQERALHRAPHQELHRPIPADRLRETARADFQFGVESYDDLCGELTVLLQGLVKSGLGAAEDSVERDIMARGIIGHRYG